jgi:hypothetical protein
MTILLLAIPYKLATFKLPHNNVVSILGVYPQKTSQIFHSINHLRREKNSILD